MVLATFVVQTLLLGTYLWYLIYSQRDVAQHRARARIEQQMNLLVPVCARELARGDVAAVRDVLALSRMANGIELARLTDLNGTTLAVSNDRRDHGLDAQERAVLAGPRQRQIFQIGNGQLESMTPVVRDGQTVALLWLEPNHAAALGPWSMVERIALTYGAMALLAEILPLFLVVQTMTRPLRRLQAATRGVVLGLEGEDGFPLPVTARNEAGELTRSFNTMVEELEDQRNGLLEMLALLDSLLGNAPIGFAFFDHDLRYVRVNGFLADICGVPAERIVGRRGPDLHMGTFAADVDGWVQQVFATGQAVRDVELTGEMPHMPGPRRTFLMHFYPVQTRQEAVRWVGAIVVEITDRLQAEELLRRTEKLAATGRLAASIAHEINNPLEAVTNLLYLLETHQPMEESALELVQMAQAELARVSEITQQTLRFYRQATLPNRTNLAEVLESVVTLYQPRLSTANVRVKRRFRGPAEVFGFGGELRQVFANLIGNALDAMPEGGTLALAVRRGCGRARSGVWTEGVRVTVSDTGSGMSDETRRKIFEAFFTTKQTTGTGLGLWVSEEIIRKHGGTVRVRSRQGAQSGSSFMIFFPDNDGLSLNALDDEDERQLPVA